MRLTLEFGYDGILSLPIHYNYQVQGFLYGNITDELGAFCMMRGLCMARGGSRCSRFHGCVASMSCGVTG